MRMVKNIAPTTSHSTTKGSDLPPPSSSLSQKMMSQKNTDSIAPLTAPKTSLMRSLKLGSPASPASIGTSSCAGAPRGARAIASAGPNAGRASSPWARAASVRSEDGDAAAGAANPEARAVSSQSKQTRAGRRRGGVLMKSPRRGREGGSGGNPAKGAQNRQTGAEIPTPPGVWLACG